MQVISDLVVKHYLSSPENKAPKCIMPRLGLLGLLVGWRKNNNQIDSNNCVDNISIADVAEVVDAIPLTTTSFCTAKNKTPPQPRFPLSTYQRPKSLIGSSSWDEAEPPDRISNTYVPPTLNDNSSLFNGLPTPPRSRSNNNDNIFSNSWISRSNQKILKEYVPRVSDDKTSSISSVRSGGKRKKLKRRSERQHSSAKNSCEDMTNYNSFLSHRRQWADHIRSTPDQDFSDGFPSPVHHKGKKGKKPPLLRRATEIDYSKKLSSNINPNPQQFAGSSSELSKKVIPTYYLESSSALPDPDHILGRLGHSLDSRLEVRHPKSTEAPRSLCVVWDLDEPSDENNETSFANTPCDELQDQLPYSLPIDNNNILYNDSSILHSDIPYDSEIRHSKQCSVDEDISIGEVSSLLNSYNDPNFEDENKRIEALEGLKESAIESEKASLQALEDAHKARINRMGLAARSFTLLTLPEDDYDLENSVTADEFRERPPSPYPRRCRGFRSLPGTPGVVSPATPPSVPKNISYGKSSPREKSKFNFSSKKKGFNSPDIVSPRKFNPALSIYTPNTSEFYFDSSPSPGPSPSHNGIFKYKRNSLTSSPTHSNADESTSPKLQSRHETMSINSMNSNLECYNRKCQSNEIMLPLNQSPSLSLSSDNDNVYDRNTSKESRHRGQSLPRRRRRRPNRLRDSAYFSTDEGGDNQSISKSKSSSRAGTLYRSASAEAEIPSSLIQDAVEKSLSDNLTKLPEIIASEVNRQIKMCIQNSNTASEITAEVRDLTEKVEQDFSLADNVNCEFNSNDCAMINDTSDMCSNDGEMLPRKMHTTNRERPTSFNFDLKSGKTFSYSCQDLIDGVLSPAYSSRQISKKSTSLSFADLGLTELERSDFMNARRRSSISMDALEQLMGKSPTPEPASSDVEVEGDLMELPTKHHVPLKHALKPLCRDLTRSLLKHDVDVTQENTADKQRNRKKSLVLKLKIDLDQMDGNQSDGSMEWDYYDQINGGWNK